MRGWCRRSRTALCEIASGRIVAQQPRAPPYPTLTIGGLLTHAHFEARDLARVALEDAAVDDLSRLLQIDVDPVDRARAFAIIDARRQAQCTYVVDATLRTLIIRE